jgi:hypothetical protein
MLRSTIGSLVTTILAILGGIAIGGAGSASSAATNVSYSASALQTNFQGILFGISCPTAGSCISVGARYGGGALVESFNGGTWTPTTIATNLTYPALNGVWCSSVNSCVAVGDYGSATATSGHAFVETLSGGNWTATTSALEPSGAVASDLTALTCFTVTSCVATGTYWDSSGNSHALFESLSGGTWTSSTAADPATATFVQVNSIQCFSATSCLAVGVWGPNVNNNADNQALLETLSGTTWTATSLGNAGDDLRSISCPSTTSCMAVGYNNSNAAVTESLSSGTWTRGTIPVPSGASFNGIVGVECPTSINDCVAIGGLRVPANASNADTLIETDTNGTWTPTTGIDPSTGFGFPEALSCPDLSSCVGVGQMAIAGPASVPMGVVESVAPPPPPPPPPPPAHGYWLVGSDGGIFSFGSVQFYGSMGGIALQRPVVGIVPTRDRGGYWLDASDGGVFSFGDTQFYGSIPGLGLNPAGSGKPNSLNAPIVGMVPSHDQGGYFMVASDGGVFAFGNAHFAGSCPGIGGCSGAAVAVLPDASGNGYWLVTASGNVYTFGDAPNLGAPGPQSSPITSAVATPGGGGYDIVDAAGQVFSYGDALGHGSVTPGAVGGFNPASAIFVTSDNDGYWVSDALGDVFTFGDAPNDGSMSGTHLNGSIIAASGS